MSVKSVLLRRERERAYSPSFTESRKIGGQRETFQSDMEEEPWNQGASVEGTLGVQPQTLKYGVKAKAKVLIVKKHKVRKTDVRRRHSLQNPGTASHSEAG